MGRSGHRARLARFPIAVLLAALLALGTGAIGTAPAADALSAWRGGVDLYRSGVFTTQQTWLWCTAADVQIMRNIVDRQADHSRSNQSRYFDDMRAHDHYAIPVSDGTEPSGWAAGLRHFVDPRYQLVQSTSFDAALRSAVTSLRKTNRPVGLLVAHGDHAWVLTGFTATADPARTSNFTVTSVLVVGPLWGLQSRSYGYDMRPDTRLTPSQLRGFFTPWHYARVRMAWEGRWVAIEAIPAQARATAPAGPRATPKPAATAKPAATPRPTPPAAPSASAPAPSASSVTASAPSMPSASTPVLVAAAVVASVAPSTIAQAADATAARAAGIGPLVVLLVIAAALAGGVLAAGLLRGRARRVHLPR